MKKTLMCDKIIIAYLFIVRLFKTTKKGVYMKKVMNYLRNKYYIKFILYMIIFGILSYTLVFIDRQIQESSYIQYFYFRQDFLEDFLIMMVAGIITMVTITFSTIMVVLTLYSGQFSPRTLKDFLQRKVPINILGFFVGIIFFGLITIINTQRHHLIIYSNTSLMSLILFATSMILFAYYIHYVAKSVQVNVYIDQLVKGAVKKIESYQSTIKEDPLIQLERDDEKEEKTFDLEYESKRTGYLVDINKDKLIEYLKEHNVSISVNIPLNEHVYEDDILFKYQTSNESFSFDDETIQEYFIIKDEIGSFSEYRQQTMKLVEIAVRALSPGTNDPFTAITCIDQLGFIFKKLSDTYYSLYYHDEDGQERLMFKTLNYDDLLYDHFYQIYLYGKKDYTIISSIIKAFIRIAKESNRDMKQSLWDFSHYVLKDIDFKKIHRFDYKEIVTHLKDLARECYKIEEFNEIIE